MKTKLFLIPAIIVILSGYIGSNENDKIVREYE